MKTHKRISPAIYISLLALLISACSVQTDNPSVSIGGGTSSNGEQGSSAEPQATATMNTSPDAPENQPPPRAQNEFTTDFSIHSIPYTEVLSGGPSKDGIPAVDFPNFESVSNADDWLEDVEPILRVQWNGEAKAYPIQILMWHEITNDVVGGEPITVTFCPLCNTGLAFLRTVDGVVLDFGTTGRLRFSNLIMYDRQTETWWQQATGEGIAGVQTGKMLDFVQAPVISWAQFKEAHPDGLVMSRETGYIRSYGNNPYVGYDDINRPPFLYRGPELPEDLPPVARILALEINDEVVAYDYELLKQLHAVNDTVGGQQIAVLWEEGTSSALDSGSIALGRDIGTANAYSNELDGRSLTFVFENGRILDTETGSEWNSLGKAISGELAGSQLEELLSFNHFWFSWAVFMPETRIYRPG